MSETSTLREDDKRFVRGKNKPEHFMLTPGQINLIRTIGVTEVSKKSNISRTILHRMLKGDVPELTIPTIRKLAAAFNMKDWEFLKIK